jgi:hypothetical protein
LRDLLGLLGSSACVFHSELVDGFVEEEHMLCSRAGLGVAGGAAKLLHNLKA